MLWALLAFAPGTAPADERALVAVPESLVYLVSYWVVELKRAHPDLAVQVVPATAAEVAAAFVEGRTPVAPLTRPLSDDELAQFARTHGYAPARLRVARDALAIYVERDNPLRGITLPQLDALFSLTRKCGGTRNIYWWDDLGVAGGDWKIRQIELYGPGAESGARAVFARRALCGGTYKAVLEQVPSAAALLRYVERNPAAITYAGFNAAASGVRAVPVAARAGAPFVTASPETIANGSYPLTRDIYLYVDRPPRAAPPPLAAALAQLALSPQGQALVALNGLVRVDADAVPPLSAARARSAR